MIPGPGIHNPYLDAWRLLVVRDRKNTLALQLFPQGWSEKRCWNESEVRRELNHYGTLVLKCDQCTKGYRTGVVIDGQVFKFSECSDCFLTAPGDREVRGERLYVPADMTVTA